MKNKTIFLLLLSCWCCLSHGMGRQNFGSYSHPEPEFSRGTEVVDTLLEGCLGLFKPIVTFGKKNIIPFLEKLIFGEKHKKNSRPSVMGLYGVSFCDPTSNLNRIRTSCCTIEKTT